MHRFFLIRHGQSRANAGLATIAPKDVELTSQGYEQARNIAAFLKKYTALNLIVTSRYLRTKQTAKPTRDEFPFVPHEEWNVEEFTYLSPGYMGYSTIDDRRPLVDAYWEQCQPSFTDGRGSTLFDGLINPSSESFDAFINRVHGFIRLLKETSYGCENIAVFSHEQFINAVLWSLTRKPASIDSGAMRNFRDYFNNNRIPNGAIVELQFRRSQDAWTYELIEEHLKQREPERALPAANVQQEPVSFALFRKSGRPV